MKSKSEEKKYMPDISQKEIEELRKTIEATSQKVVAENINRMKEITTGLLKLIQKTV